jgi:DNA-binding transcriptional MocR family regulator
VLGSANYNRNLIFHSQVTSMDYDIGEYTTSLTLDYGSEILLNSSEVANVESPGFGAAMAALSLAGAGYLAYKRSGNNEEGHQMTIDEIDETLEDNE